MGVEPVTQQRVADGEHVHAQLVRTAGDRCQFDAAPVATTLQYTPESQGVLAEFVVHHMPWLGRRIVAQGQVDAATVQFRLSPAQGGVGLFGFAVVKLPRQLAMSVRVTGQQNDAGGFPVQPMDNSRFRVAVFLQARNQAVLVVIGPSGDGEQQGRFIHHQYGGVLIDDADVGQRH